MISEFRYGVKTIQVGPKGITLYPSYYGKVNSFSINPITLGSGSFSSETGALSLAHDTPAGDYDITATGSGSNILNYIIKVTKGDKSGILPVQNLRVGYNGDFDLYYRSGPEVENFIPFFMKGVAKSCNSSVPLPAGVTISNAGISGIPAVTVYAAYKISCSNEVSQTNEVDVMLSSSQADGLDSTLQYTVWSYGGEQDDFPCDRMTDAFNTPGAVFEYTREMSQADIGLIKYSGGYGFTARGHVKLSKGTYTFGVSANSGGYLMINNKVMVNSMKSCNSFYNDLKPTTIGTETFTADTDMYVPMTIGYHQKTGGTPLTPKFKFFIKSSTSSSFSSIAYSLCNFFENKNSSNEEECL